MIATIEKNELVIRMPLGTAEISKSGKSKVIATSKGNVRTSLMVEGKPVTIGVNAYIPVQ